MSCEQDNDDGAARKEEKRKAGEEISGSIESGHSGSKIWKPMIGCVIGRIAINK